MAVLFCSRYVSTGNKNIRLNALVSSLPVLFGLGYFSTALHDRLPVPGYDTNRMDPGHREARLSCH
jgi:hypothetical protein